MRSYPANSPQAAARIVALTVVADGDIGDAEIEHGCWTLRPGLTLNLGIDLTASFCRELDATPLPSD